MINFEALKNEAGTALCMDAMTARMPDAAVADRHPIMSNRDSVSGVRLDIETLDDLPV
jgi:hypothetical protein